MPAGSGRIKIVSPATGWFGFLGLLGFLKSLYEPL